MTNPTMRSKFILTIGRARSSLGQFTWDNALLWRFLRGAHPLADLEGPEYLPWAPFRETDLATKEEQRTGKTLLLIGAVRDRESSAPIAGAVLDAWQTDAIIGDYDWHGYSLRGKFRAAPDGTYTIRTVLPAPYKFDGRPVRINQALRGVPHWLIEKLTGFDIGRTRPSHIHFTVSAPGYQSLTTQIYFDPLRELTPHDFVNTFRRPRERLNVELKPGAAHGADFVASFDFPLDRA